MINRILAQVQHAVLGARLETGELATDADIYYCYRLFLNREPDEAGLAYWRDYIHTHRVPVFVLSDAFLNSDEVLELQATRNEPQLVELPDFRLYIRPNDFFFGGAIAREQSYEPYVTNEIDHCLKPGMVFIDIGANIGYYTMLAASRVGPEGQVHAFEPRSDNYDLLERSREANNFQNVELYPYAVAEKAQSFFFTRPRPDTNGRLIRKEELTDQSFLMPTVEAVTLDEALPQLGRLDLLKMDIEGAEPRAWQGMQQTLQKYRPVVVFEFNPPFIRLTSQIEPEQFLEQVHDQYRLHVLERSGGKSASLSVEEIMSAHAHSGISHLDLVGYPR